MLIEIFVAPEGCSSCGKAQQLIKRVLADYPDVELREIHITDAADRVVDYGVFSTPFIAIDGKLEFVGVPREADLRGRIGQRTQARPG